MIYWMLIREDKGRPKGTFADMARGRMVNKKISNSKRVNDLPLPAQLLYTWLIPHLDCRGVFFGSPQLVKSLVFPRKSYTVKQIESWLVLMENAKNDEGIPLIVRYLANGEKYLFMPGFVGEQVGLRTDKEHPEYVSPPSNFRQISVKNTETFRQNDGVIEVKSSQVNRIEDKSRGDRGMGKEGKINTDNDLTDLDLDGLRKRLADALIAHNNNYLWAIEEIKKEYSKEGLKIGSIAFGVYSDAFKKYPLRAIARTVLKVIKYGEGKKNSGNYIKTILDESAEKES